MASPTIATLMTHSSISLSNQMIQRQLHGSQAHLGMDEITSPTAQPGKDWASCPPCHSNSTAWFHDSVRFINNYPISFGQKSWCNLRWPADFQEHIAKIARSCRFALHNIRKIRPFLTEHAAQLLVQDLVISRLDLLQCSSGWTSIKHKSNLYKWFRMQRHDWSSTSPKEPMLHFSLSPWTGYQLQLASSSRHWWLHIEQPQTQHPPTSTHYYESTSPEKPRLLPLTITNLHPFQKPRLLPLTYNNLHPLQKPLLLPLTITNLHPLQKSEIC